VKLRLGGVDKSYFWCNLVRLQAPPPVFELAGGEDSGYFAPHKNDNVPESMVPRLTSCRFTGGEDQSYFFNSWVAGSSPAGAKTL
jgi:hypothetical protein